MTPHDNSRNVTLVVTTALAAAFNLLLVIVVCFGVMPRVNEIHATIDEKAAVNFEAIEKNREQLEANWKELEGHRATIRRLTTILDAAEAAAKTAKEKAAKEKKEP